MESVECRNDRKNEAKLRMGLECSVKKQIFSDKAEGEGQTDQGQASNGKEDGESRRTPRETEQTAPLKWCAKTRFDPRIDRSENRGGDDNNLPVDEGASDGILIAALKTGDDK